MANKPVDLNLGINRRGEIDQWANIFVDKLRKELAKKKIGKSGALARSIQKQLVRSGGDITEVFVRFHMYGRFVDMGVGNGVKAYERGTNKAARIGAQKYGARVNYVNRKPKRWFNKRKMAEIWKLREILARQLGNATVDNFKSQLGDYTEYSVRL